MAVNTWLLRRLWEVAVERITIVGTGAIGTSLGMALKKAKVGAELAGFDIQRGRAERAKKRGGLDVAVNNLEKALEGAKLVVLATPVAAMRELLEFMGPILADGAVVTDTGGTKAAVLEWADKSLPPHVNFVGGHPLVTTERSGPEGASETLFQGALYPICPAKNAHRDATRTVFEMVEGVGAKPYFMDAPEHDTYAAAVDHLPMVLSVNLMASASNSPAWREMHKMASAPFRNASGLASGDPATNLGLLETNRENLVYWIDETIKRLYQTRTSLLEGDTKKLQDMLAYAYDARARWIADVAPASENKVEMPTAGQFMSQVFLGDMITKQVQGGLRKEPKDKDKNKDKDKDKRQKRV
jgi:prephenate dehydrogenase